MLPQYGYPGTTIGHVTAEAGLAEALRLLAANPDLARLIAVEALQAGPAARYVDSGRTERLPEATAELVHCLLTPYLDPAESRRIADQAA